MNAGQHILVLGLRVYRVAISPVLATLSGLGFGCRFTPTCSQYAMDAIQRHGVIAGFFLTIRRLCRCHPFGGHGYDSVPEQINAGRRKRQRTAALQDAGAQSQRPQVNDLTTAQRAHGS